MTTARGPVVEVILRLALAFALMSLAALRAPKPRARAGGT